MQDGEGKEEKKGKGKAVAKQQPQKASSYAPPPGEARALLDLQQCATMTLLQQCM